MICPAAYFKVATRRIVLAVFGVLCMFVLPTAAQAECLNEQLRQNPRVSNSDPATERPYDVGLPDCRAYEQVSPVEKEGASGGVFYFDSEIANGEVSLPIQSLSDGSAITYAGEPFYHPKLATYEEIVEHEAILHAQYTSRRSADGWETEVGDTLGAEAEGVPTPVLPAATETSEEFVEDAQIVHVNSVDGSKTFLADETPNGSKVFFRDAAELPGVSNAAPNEPDLYEYTVPTPTLPHGHLEDLTVDPTPGKHADVQGLLGVGGEGAEEGSYVYFVAGGVLTSHASAGGCCNLYVRHNGATSFIAALSAKDGSEGESSLGAGNVDWGRPAARTAEVSPNGRYVAFGSDLPLTGQDAGREVFRYDAVAAERGEKSSLLCVSCPGGALNGVSTTASINGAGRQRYMLNDGRVLFNSAGELVPEDVSYLTQVYEYEPEGVGSCTASTSSSGSVFLPTEFGCISLISGGTSEVSDAVLAGASANGSDVFFTTSLSLLPQDQDEITDMYDAREDGGFPPPPEPACRAGSACSGAVPSPPTLGGPPASATSSGSEGPPTNIVIKEKQKPLTRSQKLANALKACHRMRGKKKRAVCEASARKRYGPASKTKRRKGR